MRYEDYASSNGGHPDPFINPARCIWAVTVQAPFTPAPPAGATPTALAQYRVILDAGSHYLIELNAGAGATAGSTVAAGPFVDTWHLHSFVLTIKPDGTGTADWRTYRVCGEDPPPCDRWSGNVINDGGHAAFHLTSVSGPEAHGIVESSTDQTRLPTGPLDLVLQPNDLLLVNGTAPPLCGSTAARQDAAGEAPPGVACGA